MRFKKAHTFDNRKILVHVALASDASDNARHVSECIASGGDEVWSIGINERSAVPISGDASRRGKCAIVIRSTACTAIEKDRANIERRRRGAEQRLTWNAVEANTAVVGRNAGSATEC